MTRELYHQKLARLEAETLDLGHVVAGELPTAIDAVLRGRRDVLEDVVAGDKRVNSERLDIEGQVLMLIATQQPVAIDMRLLASLLEVVGEVERLGDYVKGIAKIGLRMEGQTVPPGIAGMLVRMADRCSDMLHRALDGFAARDVDTSRAIILEDEVVDDLYKDVFRAVVEMGAPDAAQMERSNYYLWMAHNLERTADRVTNICERTIYVVTGTLISGTESAMETRLTRISLAPSPDEPGRADDPAAPEGESPEGR